MDLKPSKNESLIRIPRDAQLRTDLEKNPTKSPFSL